MAFALEVELGDTEGERLGETEGEKPCVTEWWAELRLSPCSPLIGRPTNQHRCAFHPYSISTFHYFISQHLINTSGRLINDGLIMLHPYVGRRTQGGGKAAGRLVWCSRCRICVDPPAGFAVALAWRHLREVPAVFDRLQQRRASHPKFLARLLPARPPPSAPLPRKQQHFSNLSSCFLKGLSCSSSSPRLPVGAPLVF